MKQVVMSQWQLRSLVQRMERLESQAVAAGNYDLAFRIQQKILEVGFALHPEWDRRPQRIAAVLPSKSKARKEVSSEAEAPPTTPTDADMAALRELSDEELEKGLGFR